MSNLPIPFSAPMVRAILREIEQPGTGKTQTRRTHPPEPRFDPDGCRQPDLGGRACWWDFWANDRAEMQRFKLPYAVGDHLYVREAWRSEAAYDDLSPARMGGEEPIRYEADGAHQSWGYPAITRLGRFRQGMHMPRWASRLTLIVTDVRVQRLQEISEADAIAEGLSHIDICGWGIPGQIGSFASHATNAYRYLWDSLNAERSYGWDANPWIAAYTFRPVLGNIDQVRP